VRVGVLTGGGDVPGLNVAIKALVERLEEAGSEVLGLRRGYAALVDLPPGVSPSAAEAEEWLVPLSRAATRRIDRYGGTVLHSSRLNPALLPRDRVPEHLRDACPPPDEKGRVDLTAPCLATIERLGLDALVTIGGDGTLAFARRLALEGVPLVAIPKTMDNDVYGTDYCIGFSTAVTRSVHFINDLRTVAGSHERLLVVELFGRYSGETCLLTSFLAATDRALLAEVPFDPRRVAELLAQDRDANPSRYAVIAVSEGAHAEGAPLVETGQADAVGHRKLGGVGAELSDYLHRATGVQIMYQQLGYLMRSGPPDSLDQLVGRNFATLAADLVLRGQHGQMVAVLGGRYRAIPIEVQGEGIKRVDVDSFYDTDEYRVKISDVAGLPMFLH
jgi:ATP-dependent phosphofructokinase / diphosphate-dependent phosphofructokinase